MDSYRNNLLTDPMNIPTHSRMIPMCSHHAKILSISPNTHALSDHRLKARWQSSIPFSIPQDQLLFRLLVLLGQILDIALTVKC